MMLVSACASGESSAYSSLSPAQLAFVVPESDAGRPGETCGTCGPDDFQNKVSKWTWLVVDRVTVVDGSTAAYRVRLNPRRPAISDVDPAVLTPNMWAEDADDIVALLDDDVEVWVAVDTDLETPFVVGGAIFDVDGRIAGVGRRSAWTFVAPIARAAALHSSDSALEFMETLL
jgi:hypothetical protein